MDALAGLIIFGGVGRAGMGRIGGADDFFGVGCETNKARRPLYEQGGCETNKARLMCYGSVGCERNKARCPRDEFIYRLSKININIIVILTFCYFLIIVDSPSPMWSRNK